MTEEQQDQKSPDEPVDQPPAVESATEGDHLSSPEPGHPTDETEPAGGVPERPHEHPEDIGDTEPDTQSSP